ncbi:MAG: RluA family pseudouridine synthase [Desulfuromonadales bacterium]|nr:MAG: RluA family pseudouridine synthase [Desulfuromonadales bacterium]
MLTYTITEKDHCRRLESFVRNLLPAAPSSYVKKLTKGGHIAVNSHPAAADDLLAAGDTVAIKESARTRELVATTLPPLDILYEDDLIVIINKAPGLPVHRTAEEEHNLVNLAEEFMTERGTPVKLRPVNRLDRGTSGATILAKSATSAGMFGRFVKETGLDKLYLAVAEGTLPAEGVITEPLEGKESETRFRCLHQGKSTAFVLLTPITGRTHQIRKHLAHIGHPVQGDRRYRGAPLAEYDGHLLHAFRVALPHPATGQELVIHAPLPEGFIACVKELAGEAFPDIFGQLACLPPA